MTEEKLNAILSSIEKATAEFNDKINGILAAIMAENPQRGLIEDLEPTEEQTKIRKNKIYTDGSIGYSGLARRLGVEYVTIRKIADKYELPYYMDENSNRRYLKKEQDIITALIKSNN